MTVAVAGLWDFGYNCPISEVPLWLHPIRDFAVDEWHMSPVSGIDCPKIHEWARAEEMISSLRSRLHLVFVTEAHQGAVELDDFLHPKNACYVFGKSTWSPFMSLAGADDCVVRCATPTGLGLSLAPSVLFTVLWHRGQQWP